MLTIDVTANTNRWRGRHPLEKVVPALVLLGVVVTRPVVPASPLVLLVATAAATVGAQIPFQRWLRALTLPATFIVTGVIGVALVAGDGPGPIPITVTSDSGRAASLVLLRSVAGVSTVVFVGMTTPMVDLIFLLRRARVPAVVTDLMTTIYRLLFDLIRTGRQLHTSQAARLGHNGFRRSTSSLALVTTAVFVQSIHRARRLQIGLDARAYDGELRVLSEDKTLQITPLVIGLGVAAGVLAVSFVGVR